jgi:regulator of replication initiation timing
VVRARGFKGIVINTLKDVLILHWEGIGLQTRYLIGIIMLISILSASLAGFGLAYFGYQPQIEDMKTELSQLNSTVSDLQSSISALVNNNSILQSENEYLNSTVTRLQSSISALVNNNSILQSENEYLNSTVASLQSDVSALETNYTMLKSENTILNETILRLIDYIGNISLITDSSYYIFKQNGTYWAKSGLTGIIECNKENCSEVIDYTLAHVPYGGAVFFEPLTSSDDAYYIDSTINPPSGTTLAAQNRMVTICLDNNSGVQAVINLTNVIDVQISNIRIDGNKENNPNCSGIIIGSDYSYGSNHLIENVVIDDCSETGLWIQYYPLNNVVINVQVFHSGIYNVKVDSADNKLVCVESGWAGWSGFELGRPQALYAGGNDNYFLNCISYGSGQKELGEGHGFSICGDRNMFVGCDAGANYQGGFVLDHVAQNILESCVGRDNGRTNTNDRIPGRWGFDLFHSNSTILSGCLSTDESAPDNKTQDWGFTEGEGCDYNTVIGCNFEGNRIGAVFELFGVHSVITDTIGYETKNSGYTNFRYAAEPIDIGTNDTFGTPKNITSETGAIMDFHMTIQWSTGANVSSDENVTVMVQALLENGTTTSLEVSRTVHANVTQVYALTLKDASELWSNSTMIQELLISAKTTENATQAEVKVFVWGSGG